MSIFNLDPTASENLSALAEQNGLNVENEELQPAWYSPENIKTQALRYGVSYLQAGVEGTEALTQGVKRGFYRSQYAAIPSDEELKQQTLKKIEAAKIPETANLGARIIYGLADPLTMLAVDTLTNPERILAPPIAATEASKTYAKSQTELHVAEGMDRKTAENIAGTEAVSLGIGFMLPASLPGNLITRVLTGAGIQAGAGALERGAVSSTLRDAGYNEMADQYKAFDTKSMAIDLALGGLFGAIHIPEVKPSDLDPILTANNTKHADVGVAPGIPADLETVQAHSDMIKNAVDSLMNDREVVATEQVSNGNFVQDPKSQQFNTELTSATDEHLGDEFAAIRQELEKRGLPTDIEFYSIDNQGPVRFTDRVRALASELNVENLQEKITALKTDLEERTARIQAKKDEELVRGELWVRERMLRAERQGDITPEQHALAKWLLDQNPNIAKDLAISFRAGEGAVAGQYNPAEKLFTIFKNRGDDMTAAHEILHHAERMMPESIRSKIHNEWINSLQSLHDMAQDVGDQKLLNNIDLAIKAAAGDQSAYDSLSTAIGSGELPKSFYQYINPSEYWAVNASRLVKERAGADSWVKKAVQWMKEFIQYAQKAFGLDNKSAIIQGLNSTLSATGDMTGRMIASMKDYLDISPNVESPGMNVAQENLNGFEPDLRVKVPMGNVTLPKKPLVLTGTNMKNAARQIKGIDEVLAKFPNADKSPLEWSKMMAYAMATDDVPIPPYRFLKEINSDGAVNKLEKLTTGQIADADHGFENARLFREAYTSGNLRIETTGKLFLWSFLSRGVSPYTQEGLFIDAFPSVDKWINKAAAGELTEADFPAYEAWAKSIAPQGSGQPGSGATHNLNAFGRLFLFKMGQKGADGKSKLQHMHEMMSDPNMTGKDIRRWFISNTEGVGIDNKVVSFTLLVAGFPDVMVLDRVQIRQLWDDGRFSGRNLYDGRKVDGKPVAGSALSEIPYGARGLLIYEAVERALAKRIENIYTALGRPNDASIGRYHWESWVADSQQEASHGTLDAILHDAKGNSEMISEVTAKEGEYGAYQYGARYGRTAVGEPYFLYQVGKGQEFQFTIEGFRNFIDAVKSPKNGVVPSKFKVTEAGNAPWYERPEVNKAKLEELANEYAIRPDLIGERTVQAPEPSKTVSNLTRRKDPYSSENIIANSPDLTIISDDGVEVPAGRALTQVDTEIAKAKQDSQGFDAAVACALRG